MALDSGGRNAATVVEDPHAMRGNERKKRGTRIVCETTNNAALLRRAVNERRAEPVSASDADAMDKAMEDARIICETTNNAPMLTTIGRDAQTARSKRKAGGERKT